MMGNWKGRGNQYIQLVKVLYCKLPINGKQLPAFPLEVGPGIELRSQRLKARVLPLCHHGSRYNQTLLQGNQQDCFLQGNQRDWDQHLQQLTGAIRSTVNRQTGFTPNLMNLGREVMLPVHLLMDEFETQKFTPTEYVKRLRSVLQNVHTLARNKLESSQCRQKRDYDFA